MRPHLDQRLEAVRIRRGRFGSDASYGLNGAFAFTGPVGMRLRVIASDGMDPVAQGWEHVSVSCEHSNRCPNWPEMCFVKDLFWDETETVLQFHPARSNYVNHHPTTLHLWRHRSWVIMPFAVPPSILVGPK